MILGQERMLASFHFVRTQLTVHSEAWRYSGHFTRWNRLKGALPGLGIGFGAFVVYSVYEALFLEDKHGHGAVHGDGGHGEEHH